MKLDINEVVALVELWSSIKPYIPSKDQKNAAEHFITNIEDAGLVDISLAHQDMHGVCDVFDKALAAYCHEHDLTEEYDDFKDWDE